MSNDKPYSDSMKEIMRLAGLQPKVKKKVELNPELLGLAQKFKDGRVKKEKKIIARDEFGSTVETTEFNIPFPPSVNKYWGTRMNGRKFLLPRGRKFKDDVSLLLLSNGFTDIRWFVQVKLDLTAYEPDRRRRDIDNLLKAILDSLSKYIYEDDSQVRELTIRRGGVDKENPRIAVKVETVINNPV